MMRMILSSDELSCGEQEVWEGFLKWIGDKQEMNINMVETVRFGLLKPDFYLSKVKPHPLFQDIAPKVDEVKVIKFSSIEV